MSSNIENKKLVFPKFEDIKVSTKTFIIMTNIVINLCQLYLKLPITNYIVIPKKRGRKKKVVQEDPNKGIADGSIITIKYENNIRGVQLKKNKNNNFFRNSVTIVMIIDSKMINFKISSNGKVQMTGCKNDSHAKQTIKYLWDYIKNDKKIYKLVDIQKTIYNDVKKIEFNNINEEDDLTQNQNVKVLFIPAMRNIDFSLGFKVDRANLDSYINLNTEYNSLLETSFGYTGVNIKIPVFVSNDNLYLDEMEYQDGWIDKKIKYNNYINMLSDKEKDKKLNKEKYNTFLVFQSGKTIMSGTVAEWMKDTYYEFTEIIKECYNLIEEKLE